MLLGPFDLSVHSRHVDSFLLARLFVRNALTQFEPCCGNLVLISWHIPRLLVVVSSLILVSPSVPGPDDLFQLHLVVSRCTAKFGSAQRPCFPQPPLDVWDEGRDDCLTVLDGSFVILCDEISSCCGPCQCQLTSGIDPPFSWYVLRCWMLFLC